jgi:hypothetical protein
VDALALANRRKMASVEAVSVRMAVAYLIIWSYWDATRAQRIGRVSAVSSRGQAPASPAAWAMRREPAKFRLQGPERKLDWPTAQQAGGPLRLDSLTANGYLYS